MIAQHDLRRPLVLSLRRLMAALLLTLLPPGVWAARECRDDLREADGYTVRSVTVEGRWMPAIPLPIKPGDRYSQARVQRAMEEVKQAINSKTNQAFELRNLGSTSVLYITRCLMVEGRSVDVIIQPYYVRVDLIRVG